jgi:hypothetical protein
MTPDFIESADYRPHSTAIGLGPTHAPKTVRYAGEALFSSCKESSGGAFGFGGSV